jgi:predicted TIM-barrel fold metal-dependent hydrolase
MALKGQKVRRSSTTAIPDTYRGEFPTAIDVFCHVIPSNYRVALEAMVAAGRIPRFSEFFLGELRIPGVSDMDERFVLMDGHPETVQVLSLTGPFLETIAGPKDAVELAKVANDEITRLVESHPGRFAAGVATLAFNDIEAALIEIDRAVKDLGLRGIQIGTDVNGRSARFHPSFQKPPYP